MRTAKLWAILAPATFLLASAPAFADSYQIFTLHSDQSYFFGGMDDAGHVVINNGTFYYNYLDGISTGFSTTAPTFTSDFGTSCTPSVPSGGLVEHGVCNNGRDAFTGFIAAGQVHPNVYVGPGNQDIFSTGGEGNLFMNSLGDIVFDDHFSDQWFEAIDLTGADVNSFAAVGAPTPATEPSTLLLLATGILAPIFFLRRRTTPTAI